MRGVVTAGHPQAAEAGAEVLRAGGNAVDAALAALCASFATEPMLTGLAGGGYCMVATPEGRTHLLDFFVEAPGRGADPNRRAELVPVAVYFGDVVQMFRAGAASVGIYGCPAGIAETHARFGSLPLAELVAPAVRLAREGALTNAAQAYIFEILHPINETSPEALELMTIDGRPPAEGELVVQPDLARALERLGAEGADPFYTGEIGHATCAWVRERGGLLTLDDLAAYRPVPRDPLRVAYRGREVNTNPPPSAGGILIAYVLAQLDREDGPPSAERLVAAMEDAQAERTADFMEGLDQPGFLERFLSSRLGSTSHVSVMDADGWACAVTATNGSCSGVVVPGTGLHLNNMMGEHDLNPLGFHHHAPGRRLPSMMAPTVVRGIDGGIELVLGSAGSNRLRSAILQVISNSIDRGMGIEEAVVAPRIHWEEGVVYAEPGAQLGPIERDGRAVARFKDVNVFFGGCQAVRRDPASGELTGAGDPRRGGAVIAVP